MKNQIKIILLSIISLLLVVTCENPEESDKTPPDVTITFPLDGATVSEILVIKANATDNEEVKNVEIYVDGIALDTLITEPYQYAWNTTIYPDNSNHSILARATDTNDNTADSELITVTVNNEGFEPPPVTITSYEVLGENISLTWSQSEILDFSSYRLYKNIDAQDFLLIKEISNIEKTSYVDTVSQTSSYTYYVSVSDESGLSSTSNTVTISSNEFYPTSVNLSIASNQENESLDLEWGANDDPDFSYYKLYRSLTSGVDTSTELLFETQQKSTTTLIDNNIQEAIEYYYKLYVYDSANLASASNEVNAIMKQNPESVILEILNTDEDSVSLSWSQSDDILFSHYTIYRNTSPGITINSTSIYTTYSDSELFFVDNSISGNNIYYYSVAVFDQVGNYSFSNEKQADVPLITMYIVPSEYPTILDAINAADMGDSVIVEEGTYYETLSVNKSIVLGSLFIIDNNESHIDNTILSGAGVNVPITTSYGSSSLEISGLTIREGNTTNTIFVDSNTDLTISNCIIIDNLGTGIRLDYPDISVLITDSDISTNGGIGLSMESDNITLTIRNCRVYGNTNAITQTYGDDCSINIEYSEIFDNTTAVSIYGGDYGNNNTITILNSQIHDNSVAVSFSSSSDYANGILTINDTQIYNNNNTSMGSGIITLGEDITGTISDSDIFENTTRRIIYTDDWSGALEVTRTKFYNNTSSEQYAIVGADLQNCILNNNYASQYLLSGGYIVNTVISGNSGGGGIFASGGGTLLNSIIWGNSMPVNYTSGDAIYSDIQETVDGVGNINTDPLFSDELFHLNPLSPCIDTGNPSPEFNDTDGTRNDMGAYGGPNSDW